MARIKRNRAGRFVRSTRKVRRRRATHNPPTHRRRTTRRRVARHNPPVAKKTSSARKSGQKGYKTPEAVRRKISLAVKRANAARKAGGSTSRKVATRRPASRRVTSGSRHRSAGGMARAKSELHRLFSHNTIKVAGGAIGAGFLTSYAINKWGAKLPGITSNTGRIAYRLLFPLCGALATRRIDSSVADGMIIGGAVSAINEAIRIIAGSQPAVAAIVNKAGTPQAKLGEYGEYELGEYGEYELGDSEFSDIASDGAFGDSVEYAAAPGEGEFGAIEDSSSPFAPSAW